MPDNYTLSLIIALVFKPIAMIAVISPVETLFEVYNYVKSGQFLYTGPIEDIC